MNAGTLQYTCLCSLNSYNSELNGLKCYIRFAFVIYFSFLYRHFILFDKPKINLCTTARIFNSLDDVGFCENYLSKYETLRTDLDKKSFTKMHMKDAYKD